MDKKQERGGGEYRLYSFLKDGHQALMTSYYGDPYDYLTAYEQHREFEPELAEVSLIFIPGEDSVSLGRPAMFSDMLVQKIETISNKQVEERYAQKSLDTWKKSLEINPDQPQIKRMLKL